MQMRTLHSKLAYCNYKNKLTSLIRCSDKRYYGEKFDSFKGNIKGTWKIINNILRDKNYHNGKYFDTEILSNGKILSDHKQIVSKFNDFLLYWPGSGKKMVPVNPNISITDTIPLLNTYSFFITPCTPSEIKTIILNIKNSNGIGIDHYFTKLLKLLLTVCQYR